MSERYETPVFMIGQPIADGFCNVYLRNRSDLFSHEFGEVWNTKSEAELSQGKHCAYRIRVKLKPHAEQDA